MQSDMRQMDTCLRAAYFNFITDERIHHQPTRLPKAEKTFLWENVPSIPKATLSHPSTSLPAATPHCLLSWVHSRISPSSRLQHQFSLMPHKASLSPPHPSLPFISGFSLITDIAQATGGNSFPRRQSRDRLAEKGTEPCPATGSASWSSVHSSLSGMWVLLYDLVRHWFVLEPGMFIQDRLHSEALNI